MNPLPIQLPSYFDIPYFNFMGISLQTPCDILHQFDWRGVWRPHLRDQSQIIFSSSQQQSEKKIIITPTIKQPSNRLTATYEPSQNSTNYFTTGPVSTTMMLSSPDVIYEENYLFNAFNNKYIDFFVYQNLFTPDQAELTLEISALPPTTMMNNKNGDGTDNNLTATTTTVQPIVVGTLQFTGTQRLSNTYGIEQVVFYEIAPGVHNDKQTGAQFISMRQVYYNADGTRRRDDNNNGNNGNNGNGNGNNGNNGNGNGNNGNNGNGNGNEQQQWKLFPLTIFDGLDVTTSNSIVRFKRYSAPFRSDPKLRPVVYKFDATIQVGGDFN